MSSIRNLVKNPQVPSRPFKFIDILLDLGNCYGVTTGHNKLTKKEIQVYLTGCAKNLNKFVGHSKLEYELDITITKLSVDRFRSDKIAFGELCREFYKIKCNTSSSPSKEEKFLDGITKRLGESAELDSTSLDCKNMKLSS